MPRRRGTRRRANVTQPAGGTIAQYTNLASADDWPVVPTQPATPDTDAIWPCHSCVTAPTPCPCKYKTGEKCYTCVRGNLPCNIDGRIPNRRRFKNGGAVKVRPHRAALFTAVYEACIDKGKADLIFPPNPKVKCSRRALKAEFPIASRTPEMAALINAALGEQHEGVVIDPEVPRHILDIPVPTSEAVAIQQGIRLAARALRWLDAAEAAHRYFRAANEIFRWESSSHLQLSSLRIPAPSEYVPPAKPRRVSGPSARTVNNIFAAAGDLSEGELADAEMADDAEEDPEDGNE